MTIEIRQVTSAADREAVFHFRYAVYIEELGRTQKHADPSRRMIKEPLDEEGVIFAAFDGQHVVGTVRYNWTHSDVGYYRDMFCLDVVDPFNVHRATITTKLIVANRHRHSTLGMRLAIAAFVHANRAGGRFDFIDCYPRLKPFFEKLGYRQIVPNVSHPEHGEVHPMILVNADREHLAAVRSPFLPSLRNIPEDSDSVDFFYSHVLPKARQLSEHQHADAKGVCV